jgi:hypothetical protein
MAEYLDDISIRVWIGQPEPVRASVKLDARNLHVAAKGQECQFVDGIGAGRCRRRGH